MDKKNKVSQKIIASSEFYLKDKTGVIKVDFFQPVSDKDGFFSSKVKIIFPNEDSKIINAAGANSFQALVGAIQIAGLNIFNSHLYKNKEFELQDVHSDMGIPILNHLKKTINFIEPENE